MKIILTFYCLLGISILYSQRVILFDTNGQQKQLTVGQYYINEGLLELVDQQNKAIEISGSPGQRITIDQKLVFNYFAQSVVAPGFRLRRSLRCPGAGTPA